MSISLHTVGGGGARLVSTRRPITPREPRRQLYGKQAPPGRPPSAFRSVRCTETTNLIRIIVNVFSLFEQSALPAVRKSLAGHVAHARSSADIITGIRVQTGDHSTTTTATEQNALQVSAHCVGGFAGRFVRAARRQPAACGREVAGTAAAAAHVNRIV